MRIGVEMDPGVLNKDIEGDIYFTNEMLTEGTQWLPVETDLNSCSHEAAYTCQEIKLAV